jgi:hypothetical protein
LPVLIEKFFEFENYVVKFMESMLAADKLNDVQKRYWIIWKTTPLLRGIALFIVKAKNQYMQPLMKVGNSTHSWKEWKSCLEKILHTAAEMKHSRCVELSNDVLKSFVNLHNTRAQFALFSVCLMFSLGIPSYSF